MDSHYYPGLADRLTDAPTDTESVGQLVVVGGFVDNEHADQLLREMDILRSQMTQLIESRDNAPFFTQIYSLGQVGLELRRPIPVTIRPDGNEFIASFFDANISTGGGTEQEAVDNLQSLIADFFNDLELAKDDELGPSMIKQRQVLLESVCRTS